MLSELVTPMPETKAPVTVLEIGKDRVVAGAAPVTDPLAASGFERRELPDRSVKELVQVFKLLADETRLRIVFCLLERGESHVRALCDRLGQSQPAVSHHLGLLRVAGLVDCRREGKHNYYRLLPGHFQKLWGLMREQLPAGQRPPWFEASFLAVAAG